MKKQLSMLFAFLLILFSFSACAISSNEPYTYTCQYNSQELLLTVDPANNTISDGIYTYTYEITDSTIKIIYPDGSSYWFSTNAQGGSSAGWSDDYDWERYLSGFAMEGAFDPLISPPRNPKNLLLIFLVLAVGFVNIAYPKFAWYCTNGWMYKDAEPSDAALIAARVSGAVCVFLGIFLLIL